jgi:hypothetical protein
MGRRSPAATCHRGAIAEHRAGGPNGEAAPVPERRRAGVLDCGRRCTRSGALASSGRPAGDPRRESSMATGSCATSTGHRLAQSVCRGIRRITGRCKAGYPRSSHNSTHPRCCVVLVSQYDLPDMRLFHPPVRISCARHGERGIDNWQDQSAFEQRPHAEHELLRDYRLLLWREAAHQ